MISCITGKTFQSYIKPTVETPLVLMTSSQLLNKIKYWKLVAKFLQPFYTVDLITIAVVSAIVNESQYQFMCKIEASCNGATRGG